MKTENALLMKMALDSLKGKWSLVVGTFVVYMLVLVGIQVVPIAGAIASLIIGGPMYFGLTTFFIAISRNQDARLEQIFDGFKNFIPNMAAYLLMIIFVLLWTLLLIVPGVIAALAYGMTFFIMVDDPSLSAMEALKKSKSMMYGYKWELFCLYFRFIGWALLCVLTLGIGFLWLGPYIYTSVAKFYDDIKDKPIAK